MVMAMDWAKAKEKGLAKVTGLAKEMVKGWATLMVQRWVMESPWAMELAWVGGWRDRESLPTPPGYRYRNCSRQT